MASKFPRPKARWSLMGHRCGDGEEIIARKRGCVRERQELGTCMILRRDGEEKGARAATLYRRNAIALLDVGYPARAACFRARMRFSGDGRANELAAHVMRPRPLHCWMKTRDTRDKQDTTQGHAAGPCSFQRRRSALRMSGRVRPIEKFAKAAAQCSAEVRRELPTPSA